MKFNIENYKGKYCMHCKTLKEAKDFCKYLHSIGKHWDAGNSYLDEDYFEHYESDTAYLFNEGMYDYIYDAKADDYTILEWSDFMNKNFTKSDLKDGMIVEYANGRMGLVLNDKILDMFGFCYLNNYSENLNTNIIDVKEFNIEKVYFADPTNLSNIFDSENLTLIWERNPRKKMTKEEIETALGYKIEIVED